MPADPSHLTAVVFDFDGTIVDSERVVRAAMAQVLYEDGHTLRDRDWDAVVGRAWPHTRQYLMDLMGYDDVGVADYKRRAGEVFWSRVDEVTVFPDVVETMDALAHAGVPLAVCTSSGRAYLERLLEAPELVGRFDVSVAREDTTSHKPEPGPYLLAAARLDVDARACVAVEDTPAGTAAAAAAGMAVVGVDRGLGLDLTRSSTRVVAKLTVDDVVAVAP